MASKKGGVTSFTHWRRPRSRMYDYNYEYGVSYYKPQVRYIGETVDQDTRRSRRKTLSPPGARTFSERWAADPFYGRMEPVSEYTYRYSVPRGGGGRMGRASSIPADLEAYADHRSVRGRSVSRARSMVREQSAFRGQSQVSQTTTVRARSMTRARSMSRARSVFEGDYADDARSVRSGSYYEGDGGYYDPLSEEEWNRILKLASKEEREKSIFQIRMSLEHPKALKKKKMMQTSLAHGLYQNTLYGTITWDPAEYGGRQ